MQNRRHFINTLVRGGILSLLALLSGDLIRRWTVADECRLDYTCGNCNQSNRCQLPEADKYRLDKARLHKTNAEDGRNRK